MHALRLFTLLVVLSLCQSEDLCNCQGECFTPAEIESMIFGFDFARVSDRSTNEVTGNVELEMDGVAGDDIGASYSPTDEYEWVEGGGVKLLSNLDGSFSSVNDYTARFVGPGNEIQNRMKSRITSSVFTIEAWVNRTRGYNEGTNGSGRRIFALSGAGDAITEAEAADQITLLQLGENGLQVRWPVDDNGLHRMSLLRMNVFPTTAPEELEHVVIVVDLPDNNAGYGTWFVGPGVYRTTLTDEQVYSFHNGERLDRVVYSHNDQGNFTTTTPVWDDNDETRLLGLGAPPWERTSAGAGTTGLIWQRQFGGDLYWIAMYDRALTDAEVQHLYSLGPQPTCAQRADDDDDDDDDGDGSNPLTWLIPSLIGVGAVVVIGGVLMSRRGKGSGSEGGDDGGRKLLKKGRKGSPKKGSPRKGSPVKKGRQQPELRPVSEMSVQTTASSVMPRVRRNPDGSFA